MVTAASAYFDACHFWCTGFVLMILICGDSVNEVWCECRWLLRCAVGRLDWKSVWERRWWPMMCLLCSRLDHHVLGAHRLTGSLPRWWRHLCVNGVRGYRWSVLRCEVLDVNVWLRSALKHWCFVSYLVFCCLQCSEFRVLFDMDSCVDAWELFCCLQCSVFRVLFVCCSCSLLAVATSSRLGYGNVNFMPVSLCPPV